MDTVEQLIAYLDPDLRRDEMIGLRQVSKITCADGFKLSVQASQFHYCSPRSDEGSWYAVEVGFPTAREERLIPYIDGDETTDPTQTVYGYVPVAVVASVIDDHGGFSFNSALKGK